MRRFGLLAIASLLALATAGAARADGDPASDFLYLGTLYPSFVDPPSSGPGGELRGVLAAAKQRGFPIKVALIEAKQDLGQYPQLFAAPQRYARLLASELDVYRKLRAPVVVVTPNGLGVAGNERRGGKLVAVTDARAKELVRGIAAPAKTDGDTFATVASAAVRQIAKAEGHPLPAHVTPVADPSATAVPKTKKETSSWLLVGGVAGLFFLAWLVFELIATVRERRRPKGSSEPG